MIESYYNELTSLHDNFLNDNYEKYIKRRKRIKKNINLNNKGSSVVASGRITDITRKLHAVEHSNITRGCDKINNIYSVNNKQYNTYNLYDENIQIHTVKNKSIHREEYVKNNDNNDNTKNNNNTNNNTNNKNKNNRDNNVLTCNFDIIELACPCLNYSIKKKNLRNQGYMVDKPYDYYLYPEKYGSIKTHGWHDTRVYYKYSPYYTLELDGKYYYHEY